jgi:PEP-CTERM motif
MRLKVFGAAVLFVGFVHSSFGARITFGSFDISGTIFVTIPEPTGVLTPAGPCLPNEACIIWQNTSGTNSGEVDILPTGLPNGDIPASIAGNDAANVLRLMNPPDNVYPPAFNLPLFMSFNYGPGITTTLTLTTIMPGMYTDTDCGTSPADALAGQVCTPTGSEFSFVNVSSLPNGTPCDGLCQATVAWEFSGILSNPPESGTWTGSFTSQFPLGTSYQTLLSEQSTNGYVAFPFSGSVSDGGTITLTTVPEPGSLSLMMIGTGLIGLALSLRSRPPK